jgi:MFS family permease
MFRALRHRNFKLFFGGQLISLTGTWMQSLAQGWLVYRLTHSAVLLGTVGFAGQIPVLFFGPLAGIIADRHRRHRIVIATQAAMMCQALLMAILTLTRVITVSEIFVLAIFLGVCNAFDIPARQSFLVEMVGEEDLMNAIALNSSIFNSARIVGPAVAGILVAALGEGMCFLINGLSFIAVIAGLLMMRVNTPRSNSKGAGKWEQFREGVDYTRKNVAIRSLLLLLGVVSLLGMSYMVLMPIFADRVLHSGSAGLGWLMTSAGFGALLAALSLARRKNVLGLDRVVAQASAGFGVSLVLFGFSRSLGLSLTLLVPAGFCIMVQMAATNTLVQSIVSDPMRGRVMGLYTMMFLGVAPFGSLLAGFLAQRYSAPFAVIFGGLACTLSASVFGLRLRHLKIDSHITPSVSESPSDAV